MKKEKIAKVGDKIRIVNPVCTGGKYRYGDVFEVGYVYANGRDVITKTTESCFVYHLEYELVDDSVVDVAKEIDWQGSQINWQVGQEVWCAIYGKGVVEAVLEKRNELEVRINGEVYLYDLKGCPFGSKVRTLFFSEPIVKIEGDKYPPKKPFTPTLKEGEGVLLLVSEARYPKFVTILKEGETAISYLENGQEQRSYKQGIKIKRIGEEVKL